MKNTLVSLAVGLAVSGSFVQAEEDAIEKVVVVSSRIQQPAEQLSTTVSILDEADIEARFAYGVSDILRTIPSVNVSNSGGIGKNTTVRIRGEEGFRSKLFLDGVELSDPTAPQIGPIFDDILSNDFSSIEVLRGTQGFAYGADAGGVISIQSKRPENGLEGSLTAELASFDSKRLGASVGFANEESLLQIQTSRFNTDGFNAQQSDTSGERDGYENQSVHVRLATQLGDDISLQYVLRNNDGDTQYDGCFDSLTFASSNNCDASSDYQTQKLTAEYQRNDISNEFSYSKTEVARQFYSNDQFSFENKGEIEKFELLGHLNFDNSALVYGADLKKDRDLVNTISRNQHGLFVEYLGSAWQDLHYSFGVRSDDNDTFGQFTSYRIAGNYQWSLSGEQALKLKVSYGTGFRAPSLFEQAYNDGPFAYGDAAGLALTEEQSEGLDVGLQYIISGATSLTLTYFDQSIEDEIIFDAVAFQGYLQITGNSESRGFEIELDHQFDGNISLWGNYTYNDTETSSGEQRLRRPEDLFNIGLRGTWFDERLDVSVFAHYEAGAIDVGGTPLDSYTTFNSNISWQVNDHISFVLRANNLFDEDYQEVIGFNTAGRTTSLGIEIDF